MIRVHIEIASAITKAGLEALLREQAEIELVGSDAEADVCVREHAGNGTTPAVVLTDEGSTRDALRAGARAALPSAATPSQIVAAIYAAAAGLAAIPAGEMALLVPSAEAKPPAEPLTPREMDVLEMLAEGLSNKMIAYRLNISGHTAKFHVNAILAKLGAGTRTEAVTRGIRLGLIQV
jgi:two-component system, NarL family, nitrate/nitrite response regulator NarL